MWGHTEEEEVVRFMSTFLEKGYYIIYEIAPFLKTKEEVARFMYTFLEKEYHIIYEMALFLKTKEEVVRFMYTFNHHSFVFRKRAISYIM